MPELLQSSFPLAFAIVHIVRERQLDWRVFQSSVKSDVFQDNSRLSQSVGIFNLRVSLGKVHLIVYSDNYLDIGGIQGKMVYWKLERVELVFLVFLPNRILFVDKYLCIHFPFQSFCLLAHPIELQLQVVVVNASWNREMQDSILSRNEGVVQVEAETNSCLVNVSIIHIVLEHVFSIGIFSSFLIQSLSQFSVHVWIQSN